MSIILWFQLLHCEDLLLFFILLYIENLWLLICLSDKLSEDVILGSGQLKYKGHILLFTMFNTQLIEEK